MGILLSIFQSIFSYLRGSEPDKYRLVHGGGDTEESFCEKPTTHSACRSSNQHKLTTYQSRIDNLKADQIIYRTFVPDDKVSWSVKWPEYKPIEYTAAKLLKDKPTWADCENPLDIKNWNRLDGEFDRRSHMGVYETIDGIPRNPVGRTGVSGRGQLGKWGPNHAADPVVTRWKRDENGQIALHSTTKKPILQFVSIRRLDTNEWAIPGGMCDPGEKISQTLKREFMEEATDSMGSNKSNLKEIDNHLSSFFEKGVEIYRGYVDDPRNTDNSWMETVAYNFHDEDDSVFKNFKLTAGDDAGSVTWMDIDSKLKLYASHKSFIEKAAKLHNAHW